MDAPVSPARVDPDNCPALYAALATAQATLRGAMKDSDNPFFDSKYADLASVWEVWREVGPVNGLAILQFPEVTFSGEPEVFTFTSKKGEPRSGVRVATTISVRTRLAHISGEYVEDVVSAMLPSGDPQAVGSAITYLRRYGMSAVVGVAPEDDDAERTTRAVHQNVDATTGEVREPLRKPPVVAPVTLDSMVPFGKHKDKTVRATGRGYFEYLSDQADFADNKGRPWHTFTVAALKAFAAAESDVDRAAKPDLSMPDFGDGDATPAPDPVAKPSPDTVALADADDIRELRELLARPEVPLKTRTIYAEMLDGLGDKATMEDVTKMRRALVKAVKSAQV